MSINHKQLILFTLILIATAFFLSFMGRQLWGSPNVPGIWCNSTQSSCNSQYLLDAYSLTHILHGFLFYFIFYLLGKKKPMKISTKFLCAMVIESLWEIIENTEFVIYRYREATISFDYFGDSVMNSLVDILAAAVGFAIAYTLPLALTLLSVVLIEGMLLFWIKDSLVLNIIQLVISSDAIRNWQSN